LLARAEVFAEMGDYAKAVADSDRAIALDAKNATAYNNRCWSLSLWNHDLDKALAACDRAIELVPKNPAALDSRGFVHFRLDAFPRR